MFLHGLRYIICYDVFNARVRLHELDINIKQMVVLMAFQRSQVSQGRTHCDMDERSLVVLVVVVVGVGE